MREAEYQRRVIRRLKSEFPGCVVIKTDTQQIQGLPDLLILHGSRWAMLEVKASHASPIRPNQEHYVKKFDYMGFASFIFPSNEDEVFYDLQCAFAPQG